MSGRPGAMSMTSSVQPRPVYLVEDNGTATLVAGGQKSRVKQVLANGLPGVANELSSGAPVVFYGLVPGPKPMAVGMALGNSPGGTTVTLFVPGAALAGIKPMLGMMMGHMAGGPPMQGPGMPGPGMNNQGRGMPGAAVNHRTRTRVSTATPVVQARPNPNTAMQKQTHVPTKAPSTAKPKKMHVSRALAKRLRTELSMGKYYVSIGDASMAKTCLDNIVQRVPGTRWARKAKRALAKLKQRNDG